MKGSLLRSLTLAGLLLALTATQASAFQEPQNIRSKNGVLETTLTAQEGDAVMAGKKVGSTMTWNGQFPGPTLHVRPGDQVKLKIVNKLREPTNFHFHGMHVSPSGIADNILRTFEPGSTTNISLKVPHDHANGLYWYHPHLHPEVNTQVLRGLDGMISVEGGKEHVAKLDAYKQRLIALNLVQFNAAGTDVIDSNDENDLTATTTVNGRINQTISMRPGETELWRIANMSNEGFYKLNLEGHRMWIVGEDGTPTRVAESVKQLIVAPGQRFEILVKAGKAGSYTFRQLPHSEGFNSYPAQDLLTMKVAGKKTTSTIPKQIKSFEDLSKQKVDVSRKWTLSFGTGATFSSEINGKTFDPNRVDTRAKLGSVEEWTFVNKTTEDHPIHIHTNDFQVTKINGKAYHANGLNDDYIVPRSGSLTFRIKPQTYTGLTVFHCHILFHEDTGMMATVRYVKDGASTAIRPRGAISVHDEGTADAALFGGDIETEPIANTAADPQASSAIHDHTTVTGEPAQQGPFSFTSRSQTNWLCRLKG